ncbi:ER lumen protein-retaining receptor-like [Eupeodes corollae]|uniref:ER lumen protein-retaining receptor-like n=1 Tax=Eupeodes corollae TaxID=290404 RepID=UPI00248FB8AC|nr:ER lumen protein-retaining receptor-like [Eupeodes corollae]
MVNGLQLIADMLHLVAIIILLLRICVKTSCADVSIKSQILFCIVYCARYMDLFTVYISTYNSAMKIGYIGVSLLTILLIHLKSRNNNENASHHDSFRIEFLVVPCALLALFVNHEFTCLEVLWTFSIYLEAVAILPQFFLICKIGKAERLTVCYLVVLWLYRVFYLTKWGVKYVNEGSFDFVSVLGGIVQTSIYIAFLFYFIINISRGKNLASNLINSPLTLSSEDNLKEKATSASVYCIPIIPDHSISHNIDIKKVLKQ